MRGAKGPGEELVSGSAAVLPGEDGASAAVPPPRCCSPQSPVGAEPAAAKPEFASLVSRARPAPLLRKIFLFYFNVGLKLMS